ncbi:MAG TPA: hypothetical protein EYG38_12290 [Verrucomicrobia bacterium]|nr:hypothetical protein [Verrucomicrobiota bacterium]
MIRYWFSITAIDETITRFPAAELPTPNFACYIRDKNINTKLPAYSLLLKKEDLQNMHYYPRENQTYPATFIFNGKVYDHIRIRIRGAYARSWPKKAYKIFFNKDRLFKNRSRLNLNSGWKDPAMIREVLSYYIYNQSGAYSLKSQPVRFEINGRFWGMFIEVEQPEKHYLSDAGLKGAVLYKADSRRNESDERDHGLPVNYQRHYQKETQEKEPYDDLANFCEEIRKHQDSHEFFSRRLDLSKYINFLCATALTQKWDSFNKNHFIGKTRDGSGKWFVLPWDLDRTLGDHWSWSFDEYQLSSTLGTQFDPGPTGWNRLADRFFRNTVLQKQFDKRLMELLQTEFTEGKMFDWIDGIKEQISEEAEADQKKWGNQGYWKTEMENLKNTLKNRRSFLLEELNSRGLENKN